MDRRLLIVALLVPMFVGVVGGWVNVANYTRILRWDAFVTNVEPSYGVSCSRIRMYGPGLRRGGAFACRGSLCINQYPIKSGWTAYVYGVRVTNLGLLPLEQVFDELWLYMKCNDIINTVSIVHNGTLQDLDAQFKPFPVFHSDNDVSVMLYGVCSSSAVGSSIWEPLSESYVILVIDVLWR